MNLPSLFDNRNDRWLAEPFQRFSQLQQEMDRLLAGSGPVDTRWGGCDIEETEDHFLLSLDVPGMKKDDIKIELRGHTLSISGERSEHKEEKRKGNQRAERFYGSFARSFTLPDEVKPEQIEAEYRDGVLSIAVPKAAAAGSRQIKIGESKPGLFDRLLKRDQKGETKKSESGVEVKGGHKVA
jgi:HSP20 family protein